MSGNTPADRAQARLAAIYGTDTAPQTDFRSIARRTKVPVNLLMALDGGAGNLRAVEEQASRISAAVSAGKPLEAAVVEVARSKARESSLAGEGCVASAQRIAAPPGPKAAAGVASQPIRRATPSSTPLPRRRRASGRSRHPLAQ